MPRSSRSLGLPSWNVWAGDCRDVLPTLPDASFDACICDPPYSCIKRSYGILTEAEWFGLMRAVVPEVRRVLKPKGSAVFVLQPNSRKVGSMRGWLWEFMAWVCREWNMVQDAWWWNHTTMPTLHCRRDYGLMRPSLKCCVWAGASDCYRDQGAVLWRASEEITSGRLAARAENDIEWHYHPSGHHVRRKTLVKVVAERTGVTPFNVLPLANTSGRADHGACTPLLLCDWWTRYVVPPGSAVLDPFCGSGTTGVAALRRGCTFVGVEKEPAYIEIARKRLTMEFKSLLEARKNAPTQA